VCCVGWGTPKGANSKCKVLPDNFEEIKVISWCISGDGRCPFKFDHQLGSYCYKDCSLKSVDNGKERVEVAAGDDKRQITAIFTCTLSGKFLPFTKALQPNAIQKVFHVLPTGP